jgi:tryptophanyl-tRNA synthetase
MEFSRKIVKPRLDPWSSLEIKDYESLFKEFGLQKFPEKWKKELGHYLFRRNIVIAHRDFQKILERIRENKPFINMTGIATSGKLHFGHKVILDLFIFFKKLGAKNFFGICDLDAYTSRDTIKTLEEAKRFAVDNLANALALGLSKKDVYVQSGEERRYYEFAFELSKKITTSEFQAIYGHLDLGKIAANLLQYADILHGQLKEYCGPMPSLTIIALEQDPHLRAVRDVARKLHSLYNFELPCSLYITHMPGLKEGMKMSSSKPETAIFLTDSPEEAERKIMRAFTGGRGTIKEQREKGGEPERCKVFALLKFHHPDDNFVENVYKACKNGELICGDCKKLCAEFVKKFLEKHLKKYEAKKKIAEKMIFG